MRICFELTVARELAGIDVCLFGGNTTEGLEICIAVPVEFGAQAVAGMPGVQCGEASHETICTDCTSTHAAVSDKKAKR